MDECCAAHEPAVIACSALKRDYRDRLRGGRDQVHFVWLQVSRDELERRLGQRQGHFMPARLLDSQLTDLQPLQADEPGACIHADDDLESVVDAVMATLPGPIPEP